MPVGQTERHIAGAQADVDAIFLLDQLDCFQCDQCRVAIVADRHDQRIDDDVLGRDAHFGGALDDDPCRSETSFRCGRDALLADRQADDRRPPVPDDRQDAGKLLLLPVDRVHERLAGRDIQASLQNFRLIRIDAERHVHHREHGFDHHWHDRRFIDLRVTYIDIQHFRAPGHLSLGQVFNVLEVLLDQRLSQFLQAGRVQFLPDHDERPIRPDDYFLCIAFQDGMHTPSLECCCWFYTFAMSCCAACGSEYPVGSRPASLMIRGTTSSQPTGIR